MDKTLPEKIQEWKNKIKNGRQEPYAIYRLCSDYKNYQLYLSPDYQRLFKWTLKQKSDFIESLLLGIPIPPIFVFGNKDNNKENSQELIDGLQRVSTLLEFLGVLRSKNTPWNYVHLKKYIEETENQILISSFIKLEKNELEIDKLKDKRNSRISTSEYGEAKEISSMIFNLNQESDKIIKDIKSSKSDCPQKIFDKINELNSIKNERALGGGLSSPSILNDLGGIIFDDLENEIKDSIIKSNLYLFELDSYETNEKFRFELFYRLNSGGTQLTNQEIRNSVLLYQAKDFYDQIMELRNNSDFQDVLGFSEADIQKEKDTEYILRFIANINISDELGISKGGERISSVSEYIDSIMWKIIDKDADIKFNGGVFLDTFKILNDIGGNKSLKKDMNKGVVMVPAFDSIVTGIAFNSLNQSNFTEIQNRIMELWKIDEFKHWAGDSKNGKFVETKLVYAREIGKIWFNLSKTMDKSREIIKEKFPITQKGNKK